jgi:hypothetical protein
MCISVQRTQNISAIISATNKSNFGYYEKQFRHFGFGADHLLSEAILANIYSLSIVWSLLVIVPNDVFSNE